MTVAARKTDLNAFLMLRFPFPWNVKTRPRSPVVTPCGGTFA